MSLYWYLISFVFSLFFNKKGRILLGSLKQILRIQKNFPQNFLSDYTI